jgi:hypothetical protein
MEMRGLAREAFWWVRMMSIAASQAELLGLGRRRCDLGDR